MESKPTIKRAKLPPLRAPPPVYGPPALILVRWPEDWGKYVWHATKSELRGLFDVEIDSTSTTPATTWEDGLQVTAEHHYTKLMAKAIERGAHDWNAAMRAGARGGWRNVVDFFVEKGADDWLGSLRDIYKRRWRRLEWQINPPESLLDYVAGMALAQAPKEGRNGKEVVKECLAWDECIAGAAREGDLARAKLYIAKNKHAVARDWNKPMVAAASRGNRELVDFFVGKGANDWNAGMVAATSAGNIQLIEFFIKKGAWRFADARGATTNKVILAILQAHEM